jgi:ECF transporter S component (folate family)
MKQTKIITPIFAALLAGIGIALFSFSYIIPLGGLPTIRIDFIAVPILIGGILLGKWYGLLIGVIVDIVGFFMYGQAFGPYFIGFTINLALTGFIAGYLPTLLRYKNYLTNQFILIALLTLMLSLGVFYVLSTDEIRLGTQNFPIDFSVRLIIVSVMLLLVILSALSLIAMIKGKVFHKNELFVVINTLFVAEIIIIVLTPIWIIYLYGAPPYYIGVVSRIVRASFLFPIKLILVLTIVKVFQKQNLWSLESLF